MGEQRGPDPVVDSDRLKGTTPPESGPEGSNVVGRPAIEPAPRAFHQPPETPHDEKKPLDPKDALESGGSFDAVEPPGGTEK
ncbi:MAG: hypothetical protein GIW95_11545 [Candidatus Eremiobacteraeota bacterium]|nr:hypothetical protein [Candidatus Eremiobacteraeota bacterium]